VTEGVPPDNRRRWWKAGVDSTLKDTSYSYTARVDYDSEYSIKGQTVRCYSPKQMRKLYPEGGFRTVGESLPKNGKNKKMSKKAQEAKTGTLNCGNVHTSVSRMGAHPSGLFTVAGYVRVGEDAFIALLKPRFAWVPWALFITLFVALLVVINFRDVLFDNDVEPGIIDPVYDPEDVDPRQQDYDDPNDKKATLTDYVRVKIPLGTVEFLYDFSSLYADGPVQLSLAIEVDGIGYVIAQKDTQIKNGKIPDTDLDWDLIRTELKAGTYVGSLKIDGVNTAGEQVEDYLSIPVEIRQVNQGSISIAYTDKVYVNLTTGQIQMDYRHSGNATHNAIVQLVIDAGDTPYVISTSGVLTPGHKLTQMTLDPAFENRLQQGGYTGRMRVNYYNDDSEALNFNTDVIVTIYVTK